ncbi:MAG: ATP-binding protein [Burkholderiaceae bacterium]|nr:ATP-binding protein [Burkholderiaceae bacterium]
MSQKSLSWALTRALLPWIALLWLATSAAVGWYMQHELEEQLDSGLLESAERLLDLAAHDARNHRSPSERHGSEYLQEVPHHNLNGAGDDLLMYQVLNQRGELLLRSADAPQAPLDLPLQTGFHDTEHLRVYTLQHPSLPLFIHVGDPLPHRKAAHRETLFWLMVPLLVVVLLLWWIIHAVTRRVLAPAGRLARDLQERDGNNLSTVPGQGLPRELQTIADSANHLLQRLSDALDTERALAANAAHELRTPLATARLRLQTALGQVQDHPAQAGLQEALESLDRLSRRCEKLLQLSRAESGAALAQERINLGQLAALVAQEFWADPALLHRLQLVLPEHDDVWVRGDFDALAIALRNLVENAVRYAPEGPIVIEVALPATCSVRDQGPGIAPERMAELQKRHSRDGHLGSHPHVAGYGLGLSIVGGIVQRQGGQLRLVSPPPGHGRGLEASLQLRPAP